MVVVLAGLMLLSDKASSTLILDGRGALLVGAGLCGSVLQPGIAVVEELELDFLAARLLGWAKRVRGFSHFLEIEVEAAAEER